MTNKLVLCECHFYHNWKDKVQKETRIKKGNKQGEKRRRTNRHLPDIHVLFPVIQFVIPLPQ
jgi:hypothetical protein